jgi:hypothetical protein
MRGEAPAEQIWYHATHESAARAACRQGLIPSCWTGGDSCCVFGYDKMEDIPVHRGEWVIEVRSRALDSQLKAWWVPVGAITGVWLRGTFLSVEQIRVSITSLAQPTGNCICELSALTAFETSRWRETWA